MNITLLLLFIFSVIVRIEVPGSTHLIHHQQQQKNNKHIDISSLILYKTNIHN